MIKGIDISHHNGKINFDILPKDIKFAIIKATEGTNFLDNKFSFNRKNLREKGIALGYYHFFNHSDPVEQANWFLTNLGEIRQGEVLALDFEIKLKNQNELCNKFIEQIYKKTGFYPLFYTYSSILKTKWTGIVKNCGLWISDPNDVPRPRIYSNWDFWAVWQYRIGNFGEVRGIPSRIDLNWFNGNVAQFKKYGSPKNLIFNKK